MYTTTRKLLARGPCNVVFGNVKKDRQKNFAQQGPSKLKIARRLGENPQHEFSVVP
jgi:hypothetical protein